MDEAMGARGDDSSNDDNDIRQHKKKQRTIRNPYQKRPSLLPPISTKPIYGISAAAQAPAKNSSHVAAALSLKAPPSTTTTTAAAATSPPLPDTNQHTLDNTNNPQQSTNDTLSTSAYQGAVSISLPPWQRLPSRNLSFGSAEILSVTECVRFAAALYQGRSIRCTGVLKQVVMGQQEGTNAHDPILSCLSPPPFLAVRLSDPLHRYNDRNTKEPNGPQLWVIFPTSDATAAIHATPVGSAVTVLGEPVPLKHSSHGGWGLCARLSLTVAPTTNLALEWQALQLRRRYLLSNSVVCNQQQERNNEHKEVLQAGCGPPPYH